MSHSTLKLAAKFVSLKLELLNVDNPKAAFPPDLCEIAKGKLGKLAKGKGKIPPIGLLHL